MHAHPARHALRGALILALAFAGIGAANAQQAEVVQAATSPNDELPPDQPVSDTVIELAGWVVANKDTEGYPFAIMDKGAAQILVFDGNGKLRGAAPGLFGSAVGDHTGKDVTHVALSAIPGKDRTTPAGRFVGGYGPAADAESVLWVDYDSAISMHPIPPGSKTERRAERLATPTPDDNRISHGCINVSPTFYEAVVQPTFAKGGVFYVLPDVDSLEKTFPEFAASRAGKAADGEGGKRHASN